MQGPYQMVFPSPLASIQQYVTLVESFPRLEANEEYDLATRLQHGDDLEAAWRLITSHLRYVVYIARGYSGYGLAEEDLIQEGNIGLMRAVRRFDVARGTRLLSYAAMWIRAQIHDFIMKNWRIVKVTTTRAKRKLFFRLRGEKKRLDWLTRSEADEIARALTVTTDDVLEMEGSLYSDDVSFHRPDDTSDDAPMAPEAYIEDLAFEPAALVAELDFIDNASPLLRTAIRSLDARSRQIIRARWLADEEDRLTLRELGERLGISAERVRQIEAAAINRLRETLLPQLGVTSD